jgi:catechol 2,3-dioxygenase-like lactoylglutathione lyase family enzyme
MTIQRMDNVLIVVDDLDAVIAFFVELGMELAGKGPIEGSWVERVIGIDEVRQDVAMLRTPDGRGRIELAMFHTPKAIRVEPSDAPANTLGIRRIMFAVDDIDDGCASAYPRRRARRRGCAVRGQLSALLRPRARGRHRRTGRAAQLRKPYLGPFGPRI